MSNRRIDFKCEMGDGDRAAGHSIEINIIGSSPKDNPFVAIHARTSKFTTEASGWIAEKDLELFAVNLAVFMYAKLHFC